MGFMCDEIDTELQWLSQVAQASKAAQADKRIPSGVVLLL